jgi:hypothetical protein
MFHAEALFVLTGLLAVMVAVSTAYSEVAVVDKDAAMHMATAGNIGQVETLVSVLYHGH